MKTKTAIITLLGIWAFSCVCLADELHVPGEYATIQAGIDAASDGDTVIVADGIYTGDGNRDIDFLGKAITVRSESGPENCIIDCNGSEEDPHRAFYIAEQPPLTVDGFTITNGYYSYGGAAVYSHYTDVTINNCIITGNSGHKSRGTIYFDGGNPTITSCTISGNYATVAAGIYCKHGRAVIDNCIITENSFRRYGGGVFCYASDLTITNSSITENRPEDPCNDAIGGGIYCAGCNPAIADCTISGNTAERGGGIYCSDSSPTITNCVITDNYAYGDGGGIYCRDSSPTITYCVIEENMADFHGAGIYGCDGTIANCIISYNVGSADPVSLPVESDGGGLARCGGKIVNCTIAGNSTGGRGGGLALCGGSIINCIIAGNFSEHIGGGLYSCGGSIINCTIVGNKTDGIGGGVFRSRGSITNCIIWGNIADEHPQIYISAIPSYSCVQNWTGAGVGNIDTDPCFVEVGYWAVNGAWVEGDYHLLDDSPCINAGDPNYMTEPNETDLDGNPRVINNRVDMGAYEYWPPVQAEMKLTPQSLNCARRGKYIKAHITLPEGFLPEDVNVNEPALAEPVDVESEYIKIPGNDTGPVKVEIGFDRREFCDCVAETGQIEVTVSGYLTTGQLFIATDTVKISGRGRR